MHVRARRDFFIIIGKRESVSLQNSIKIDERKKLNSGMNAEPSLRDEHGDDHGDEHEGTYRGGGRDSTHDHVLSRRTLRAKTHTT